MTSGRNTTDERFSLCNQDSIWVLGCACSTFHSNTSVSSVSVFYIHPLFPLVLLIPSESILVCVRVCFRVGLSLTVIMTLRKFSSLTLLTILRTIRSSLEQGSRQSLSNHYQKENFSHLFVSLTVCVCIWQLKRSLLIMWVLGIEFQSSGLVVAGTLSCWAISMVPWCFVLFFFSQCACIFSN